MTSKLDDFNAAFGITYVDPVTHDARYYNLDKLKYSIPLFNIIMYIGQSANSHVGKPMLARVVLINSVVGIPVVLGLDLIASCTTQVARVIRAKL